MSRLECDDGDKTACDGPFSINESSTAPTGSWLLSAVGRGDATAERIMALSRSVSTAAAAAVAE
jgi:hypothetical protein